MIRNLEFGNLSVTVAVDRESKVLHILDRGNKQSLTQKIDERQHDILEDLGLEHTSPEDWSWILYHTDNAVTEFSNGQYLRSISLENPEIPLHADFQHVLVSRMKR